MNISHRSFLSNYTNNLGNDFLDKIHEEGILDINLYNNLVNDICAITKSEHKFIIHDYKLVLEFIEKCYSIQSFFSRCLISHFNKNDYFKIKNLDSIKIDNKKEPRLIYILKERWILLF